MSENFIEMELREVQIVDDPDRTQVLVLGEKDGERAFPIFIGLPEAKAMVLAAKQIELPRPMTHDLVLNAIDTLGGTLERVLVVKLERETFYGALEVRPADGGDCVRIDSRPSDAIVIATRRRVPLFVEEKVLAAVDPGSSGGSTEETPGEDES